MSAFDPKNFDNEGPSVGGKLLIVAFMEEVYSFFRRKKNLSIGNKNTMFFNSVMTLMNMQCKEQRGQGKISTNCFSEFEAQKGEQFTCTRGIFSGNTNQISKTELVW